MKYSVIAPAFNEEGNVEPLVEKIAEAMDRIGDGYEIIIVDDGSTDATLARLKRLSGRFPQLCAISLAENMGQTIAFQAGFDHARGGRVVTLDSDLEKDPAYIPAMIEKMDAEELDVVYFRKLYQDVSFIRKFASAFANRFRRAVTGDKAMDVGSTFVVYRRNFFKGRNMVSGFHRYFLGFLEAEGKKMGYIEGPVFNRPTGVTKYTTLGRARQGLADLFYYYLYKNRRVGLHKMAFGVFALLALGLIAPLGPLRAAVLCAAVLAVFLLFTGLAHVAHLLVLQKRAPYRVREKWPVRSADSGGEPGAQKGA